MSETARLKGLLSLYPAATRIAALGVGTHLKSRIRKGKEDALRLGERKGIAGRARPHGPLFWFHGASVGESLSVLSLIDRLLALYPQAHILVTTGTVTSARLLEGRLPERAFHQYVPLDHPDYVGRFLDHWKPDCALWIESEFWPNLIHRIAARHIPLVLVNARLSERSKTRWQSFSTSIASLLAHFSDCLAQDDDVAERLRALGAPRVTTTGNLKLAADPLPVDDAELADFRARLSGRPIWLAASTHEEEAVILDAHERLSETLPSLMTIIAPRQPDRGDEVGALIRERGLSFARRSLGEVPSAGMGVFLADTIGDLGLLFRLAPVSFLGRSLVPMGGSNPLEAARLSSAVLTGPYTDNFKATYSDLLNSGAARLVGDSAALSRTLAELLSDDEMRARLCANASQEVAKADDVLERIMAALKPYLPEPATANRSAV